MRRLWEALAISQILILGERICDSMASRFEAEKFTGKNDFGLWRMKMKAMLIQQGLASALAIKEKDEKGKEELDEKARTKRAEVEAKAHSAVVLCLGDKVLITVAKETTAAGILTKLEELCMTKSLANYMKQRLYSYRFSDDRGVLEQLEDFNKAVNNLESIDVSIGDQDNAISVFSQQPPSLPCCPLLWLGSAVAPSLY